MVEISFNMSILAFTSEQVTEHLARDLMLLRHYYLLVFVAGHDSSGEWAYIYSQTAYTYTQGYFLTYLENINSDNPRIIFLVDQLYKSWDEKPKVYLDYCYMGM